jgi:hypothetical protein
MFAAQIIDDISENDLPNTEKPSEGPEEIINADPSSGTSDKQEDQLELDN